MNAPVRYLSLIALVLLPLALASSATDDFRVRTFIGDDTTPPTDPTGLTATPVATTQIDLSWSSSTDDFELSGYQVFREGVQIATTTSTNYSDVGLTPSTTYTYFVTAFDSFNNFSASSTVATATTFALPPPESEEAAGPTTGSLVRPRLLSLVILPSKDSVVIRYETNVHTRSIIKWGRTISYELGTLAERSFTTWHETYITGLTPGTTYAFSIEGENGLGMKRPLTERSFTTLSPEDTFSPGNVRDLRVTAAGNDAVLTWTNPTDSDLAKVRVVRSDRFYPSDPQDGKVVYEGLGESSNDAGVATPGANLYYTVFTYDFLGNISSGAVAAFRVVTSGTKPTIVPLPAPTETVNPLALALSDVEFIQDGAVIPQDGAVIPIDGGKHLTISLPYDRVPEHLKTILVTLEESTDPNVAMTFLLRVNRDKTAYVATLAPLGISGNFPIRISVFDFKTAQIGYASGALHATIIFLPQDEPAPRGLVESILHTMFSTTIGYVIWFVLFLLLLALLARRIFHTEW